LRSHNKRNLFNEIVDEYYNEDLSDENLEKLWDIVKNFSIQEFGIIFLRSIRDEEFVYMYDGNFNPVFPLSAPGDADLAEIFIGVKNNES
jgi:hypothetical protein